METNSMNTRPYLFVVVVVNVLLAVGTGFSIENFPLTIQCSEK